LKDKLALLMCVRAYVRESEENPNGGERKMSQF